MLRIDAQHAVGVGSLIFHACEPGLFAIEFLEIRLGHQRPLALDGRGHPDLPGAVTIEETGKFERPSIRSHHLGGESNEERIGCLFARFECEILRLPARNRGASGGGGGHGSTQAEHCGQQAKVEAVRLVFHCLGGGPPDCLIVPSDHIAGEAWMIGVTGA